ncbi:Flp pilus assembly protein CpaB [Actinomadura pelletieri DSM 43383]|uniref:Flp pilus assembly protein CpaB n=1 Tax=Actinomadura pelletieri DSM 43383 TaxID=1120940 RepID=A0A495QJ66_9ACTN|nr:Flp pilus assembly protein CpaB [Actinomadura pelletieri]RKS72178.1 Flp pilus assembly protein CpaB [Actinomadura pelletieri DSM 43383]
MNVRSTRLRRPLAALFAAVATGLALLALRPAAPPSVRVLAAARDLPAGTTLTPSDLRPVQLPPPSVPSGALRSGGTGRILAAPMRKGEPLTDARVVGAALLRGHAPGTVATPVRIADADAVRLVRPGDHIDVLTAPRDPAPFQGQARIVVSAVPVLAVPSPHENGTHEGALAVLATDRAQAAALAGTTTPLSLTITNRSH